MLRFFTLLILLNSTVLLGENGSLKIEYTSLEQGSIKDSVSSLFGKVEKKKSFLEGNLELKAALTTNGVLRKSTTLNFFTTLENHKFLLNNLLLDYYVNNYTLLSNGRQEMHLNLLNGSFDGVLIATSYKDIFLKTFYFKHYAYLVPTLYENKKLHGLVGASLNYSKEWFDSEFSYFQENNEQRSNLYIAYIKRPYKIALEQMQYLSPTLSTERAYKINGGIKIKHLYSEVGFIHVYEGALNSIYNYGGSEFNAFGLTSFLNNTNAKNGYIDLIYKDKSLYTKLHYGKSYFDVSSNRYHGEEAGVTLSYKFLDYYSTIQALTQKSNQLGFLGDRISWIHTNLEYRF